MENKMTDYMIAISIVIGQDGEGNEDQEIVIVIERGTTLRSRS